MTVSRAAWRGELQHGLFQGDAKRSRTPVTVSRAAWRGDAKPDRGQD
jgi:hypothetical protein